ncbi:MAG: GNAT family protein [Ignavibacteriaceae bacterium]
MNFADNIILENETVLLRPLKKKDYNFFKDIAFHPEIWKFNVTSASNKNELQKWIENSLESKKNNLRYPFTIVDKKSEKVFGSTSIGNISLKDKRAEIGWTWLGLEFQGTGINKHCKFLLLQYLFEQLKFERVEFKTDALNLKSRRALQKIGAKEEGILRSHTLMHDGRRRDTVYYSILKDEWQSIRKDIFQQTD